MDSRVSTTPEFRSARLMIDDQHGRHRHHRRMTKPVQNPREFRDQIRFVPPENRI